MARYGKGHKKDDGTILGPPFEESYNPEPEDVNKQLTKVYACAKVAAEKVVKILCELNNIEWVNIIPHNVFGEANSKALSDPYRGVILIWINCLLRERNIYIYGDGEQKRAPSYVGDIMEILEDVIDSKSVVGESINIGSDKEYTLNEISNIVSEVYKELTGKEYNKPIHVKDRPLEVKYAYCSHKKAEKLLNFNPNKTNLKDGIENVLKWALKISEKGFENRYLNELEISNNAPDTWIKKLI
jgi:UDP-glucose 4-epimerase